MVRAPRHPRVGSSGESSWRAQWALPRDCGRSGALPRIRPASRTASADRLERPLGTYLRPRWQAPASAREKAPAVVQELPVAPPAPGGWGSAAVVATLPPRTARRSRARLRIRREFSFWAFIPPGRSAFAIIYSRLQRARKPTAPAGDNCPRLCKAVGAALQLAAIDQWEMNRIREDFMSIDTG